MFKFFHIIKTIKKLRKIEPDRKWLKTLRLNFTTDSQEEVVRSNFFTRRFATSLVAAALIFSIGGGFVNSAQAALPSDTLYPLKLLSEQFQSFFIVGDENKINFVLKLAERRLEEVEEQTEADSGSVATAASNASTTIDENSEVSIPGEAIIIGTIFRAEKNLEKAEDLFKKISHPGKDQFKDFGKTLKRLERLAERRNRLAGRFADRLPALARALDRVDLASVNVEEEANKIIITFLFEDDPASSSAASSTGPTSSFTSTEIVDNFHLQKKIAKKEFNNAKKEFFAKKRELHRELRDAVRLGDIETEKQIRRRLLQIEADKNRAELKKNTAINVLETEKHGFERIKELLTDGAGKSGNIPPGLLKALGIRKKLGDFFDDKEELDTVPPVISLVSVTNASSTSAAITWITNEAATSKVYYSTTTPVDLANLVNVFTKSTTALLTNHSLILTDLTASTTHHFIVESVDAANNKATSSESSFETTNP